MKKSKYTCAYCGVPEIIPTLASWELKKRVCPVCNGTTFKIKPVASGDYFGYGDDEDTKEEPGFPWND